MERKGVSAYYRKASCIAGSVNNVGQDELLHVGAGWLHPLDSDGPAGRAAAGTVRSTRRLARNRTAICRSFVRSGGRSRADHDYVVARGCTFQLLSALIFWPALIF